MQALYVDGGVYKTNPSKIGGAWAYVLTENGRVITSSSGIIVGNITNNYAEYYAALMGLKSLPRGWSGKFVSDSKITIGRVFYGWKTSGIPNEVVKECYEILKYLGIIIPQHIKGHQAYNGDLDIVYNRMCDSLCNKAMIEKWGK